MAYSNPVRLITDDPLRLLPLFACFFAAWDNHLALDSPRKDFFWTTLALLMNWYNFWNYIDPLNVLFERPVRWLSREEMRVRLAMRARLDHLRALPRRCITHLHISRFMWTTTKLLASLPMRPELTQEVIDLDSILNSHVLRLFERSSSFERAKRLYLSELAAFSCTLALFPARFVEDSQTFASLKSVEEAWLDLSTLHVTSPHKRHGLAPQAGWEVMLHHLLLNAVELLEEQWQLIPLPAHLSRLRLRFRITRWRTTFAFVLSSLALALCVARRTLIGKGYYWPLWDIPLLLLFKRTQPAPYLNLDSTVQAKGNQFVETATTAILDSRLAGVDVGNAAIQFIRLRAASVMMCEAETELHEVILEAVLVRDELKRCHARSWLVAPVELCDFSTFCNLFRLLPSYVVLYRHL
ncbi:Proteophosphoglycan ppg4 [Rhodotorula toruloides ATCC 204091]|uniref:BY PROTMAP: gi/342321057/gb/EGU12995.1/ Proteophosphoglycan ppg4 [Rhodotorula glutinis ATCC 204091] n=1 Tax=Rhodotorula toruloides TaxID=5286 RepID=A0A0K3CBN6_RHOTO|nr:Proteophosphoglycan ppg4 [Rhodotorula toruloides ATCC 204091]